MPSNSVFDIPTIRSERLPPDPKGTALALQRIGYTLEDALADLIDNSIDAQATKVLVRLFRTQKRILRIAVVDDGQGMSEQTLHRAMQYGVQVTHDQSDLGKYGVGLKTASFSQCQSLTVLSRQSGQVSGRKWTLQKMQADWRCEVLDSNAAVLVFEQDWGGLKLRDHGTIVLWDELDALGSAASDIDRLIAKTGKRLPTELGMRFHRFISSGRVQLLQDVCNLDTAEEAITVVYPALDPFGYASSGKAGYPITFKLQIPDHGDLPIVCHIWPPNSQQPEYKLGGGRIAERQGFYFYRNDRLIQSGGWNGVRESDSEPHCSLARAAIDLPPEMDSLFSLTIQKSEIVTPPEFRPAVEAARCGSTSFNDYIAAAVSVYRDSTGEDREEMLVPSAGLPMTLQRRLAALLGSKNGDNREIRFEWKDLPEDRFFEADLQDDSINLNLFYRPYLVDKGSHSNTDAPVVKVLLFLLLSADLRKLRASKKREEWHDRCNAALVAAIKGLR